MRKVAGDVARMHGGRPGKPLETSNFRWHPTCEWQLVSALNTPPKKKPEAIPLVIIDRHTFIDLATHLEGASDGVLEVTKHCVSLCEDSGAPRPEQESWVSLVESLVAVNGELTALEQTLRALLEANREEESINRLLNRTDSRADA